MRWLLSLCVLVGTLAWVSAADDKKDDKKPGEGPIKVVTLTRKDPVDYLKDIDPILVKKCAFCHSGNVKEGKFDLSTYEALMKGGKKGKPVVPGKSAESLLVKLSSKTDKPFMPPKTEEPLTPEELALLKLWVDQGAKAPTGVKEKPKIVIGLPPANVNPVRALTLSPDKATLVAGRGNQIHVYEAASGNLVRSLEDPKLMTADKKPVKAAHISIVESLSFSPDGKYVASGSFQEVTIWDIKAGTVVTKITGFADRVVALAFDSKSTLLATGGGAPTEDGELKVYEVPSGKLVIDVKNSHSDTVFGVCFNPDGKMLASCGADKFVKIFEMPSGKFVKSFEGHTHHVLDVGWKSDGKLLASGGADNVVKIWDFEKGEQVRTINAHQKQVTRLLFVGTGANFVTCSGDGTAKLWNADNGGNTRNFAGGTDYVYAVGVTPDGSLIATGGEDSIVRIYNGTNGQVVKSIPPPGAEAPKEEPKKK